MKVSIHYRFLILSIIVIIAGMFIILASSCNEKTEVIDPTSDTPGYKLFKGTTNGFRISFEYPDSWGRVSVGRVGTYNYMPLLPPDCSVIIDSDVNKNKDGDYTNASEVLQSKLDSESTLTDFKILNRDKIQLGQGVGEEVIYSYVFPGQDPHMPKVYAYRGEIVISRTIDVDYRDRIYDINLIAAVDKYDNAKIGFEHLINSFKFLD